MHIYMDITIKFKEKEAVILIEGVMGEVLESTAHRSRGKEREGRGRH